jgi:hypothetical protein
MNATNPLRNRLHRLATKLPYLVAQISDENLEEPWMMLRSLYYDVYMLKAIEDSKRQVSPGDTLNQEEAAGFLSFF